jgi:Uma2 family endonuclease
MRTGPSLTDPAFLATLEHQHRLSVDEYHRMVATGLFEDARLELLEGVIVEMSPQTPRHARIIRLLCDAKFVAPPPEFVVQAQLPLTVAPDSEPEPDVAVVPRTATEHRDQHPTTAALVFEVAGESLRKDRLAKSAIYAQGGIPEYVIVNLTQGCLEVHRNPDGEARRYRSVVTLTAADRFESEVVAGFAFAIGDLLR